MTILSTPASRYLKPALALALAAILLPLPPEARSQLTEGTPAVGNESFEPKSGQAGKDVIWVPTPTEIVEAMLDMASVKAGDKLVDLGAGDGRIAIAAAKRGANATGIEYNPDMVALSKRNAMRAGVTTAQFVQGDIFQSDFSDADVVTMYLLPALNERLRPQLLDMKPGTRVASHQFTMGNWKPDARRSVAGHEALFWVVPAKVGGTWQVKYPVPDAAGDLRVEFKQEYQDLEARARWGSTEAAVSDLKLVGGDLSFSVADGRGGMHRFAGTAGHDGRMTGTVSDASGRQQPFTAARINSVGSL
ncbi:MAG: class I SAM-dependent methyltransferase [Lautropia sp.]|nr:class I SAM-dependent methyltransferase [Lautropia sp.]